MLVTMAGLALTAPSAVADTQIPDMLLHLDPGAGGKAYALVVEKISQQLLVYAYDGEFRQIAKLDCSTGKKPGDKAESGDGRTPEGVYFFTQFFPDRDLAPLYGTGAYPLDYPNLLDRIQRRNGHSIWLHGTNKPFKSFDSNGCIALQNHDLDQTGTFITLYRTPILIAERLNFVAPQSQEPVVQEVKSFLKRWQNALEIGSYQDFLSLYTSEFLPNIDWWPQWSQRRGAIASEAGGLRLELENLTIARDREHLVVLFDQYLRLGERRAPVATRKLYLRSIGDSLSIEGEEMPGSVAARMPAAVRNPLLTALQAIVNPQEPVSAKSAATAAKRGGERAAAPAQESAAAQRHKTDSSQAEIALFVELWIKAWSGKNNKAFAECYAEDFSAGSTSRQAFLDQKEQLNQKNERIRIAYSNLAIRREGRGMASVSFLQRYESSSYRAVGIKHLSLKQENGKWKIYRESWSKAKE